MNTILPIAQGIIAILLKKIFWATIVSGALFIILALVNLVV